jgi:hypothetical protein
MTEAPRDGGKFAPVIELTRLVWHRRAWLLAPLVVAIALVLVFVTVAEMPVLIPFFYAVF